MNNNITLKRYGSLREMTEVIDESKILVLDNQYPNTFVVVSYGENNTFGFVTDDYGCGYKVQNDPINNINYIGIGKFILGINNNGNLLFQIPLKSILVDFVLRAEKDLIVVCELDVYSIAYDKVKWCTGLRNMLIDYQLVNDGNEVRIELDNEEVLLVDSENGMVSLEPKKM